MAGDQSLVEQKEITRSTTGPVAGNDHDKMVNEKCLTAQHYPINWTLPPGELSLESPGLVPGSHHKTLIYCLLPVIMSLIL